MRLFERVADLKSYLTNKGPVGFVSIFVNPTQFNNPDDLKNYPRTLEKDCELLQELNCDVVFAPPVDEIYPEGMKNMLNIDFGHLDKVMEGKFRPSHFNGVATVVKRLFEIVEPQFAFFGRKDYQQLLIIKAMAEHYHLPIEIIGCQIVREKSGLALSSRNALLSSEEKMEASAIHRILSDSKKYWEEKYSVEEITERAFKAFAHTSLKPDYFELCNADTLLPVKSRTENIIACTAAYCGKVRLIDNLLL